MSHFEMDNDIPLKVMKSVQAKSSSNTGDNAARASETTPPPPPPTPRAGETAVDLGFDPDWRFYLAFATLAIITLAAALDATSLSVAIPIVAKSLDGTAIEAFWAGTSFLLTSTVFQPCFASLSAIFGRKALTFVALTFFAMGAIIAGSADGFKNMLIGRSFQGVGAAGVFALTEIIVTDMVPLRQRGKWFGFISGTWAIGSVTGPIVGGAFAENATWRWIFWINLPFIGIGYIMVALFLKLQHTKEAPFIQQLKRVDWFGSFLFIASITSILIPISWGGVMYDWNSWRTLVPLAFGVIGSSTFVSWELYMATEPMIRFGIFTTSSSRLVYLQAFLHGIILWSLLYYAPIYYEAVKDLSPIMTGVALFPETFTTAPAAIIVGIIVAKTGRYRWALWSGWILTTLGVGLLQLLDVNTSTVAWIFLNIVPGLGCGILFSAMGVAIPASCPVKDMAFAVAFMAFFRTFGQSVGVAVGGTIFQNQLNKKLRNIQSLAPLAEQYSKNAAGLVQVIKQMPHDQNRSELVQVYADSLKVVWAVMCGLAAVGLISSIFVKEYTLNVKNESEQRFRHNRRLEGSDAPVDSRESADSDGQVSSQGASSVILSRAEEPVERV